MQAHYTNVWVLRWFPKTFSGILFFGRIDSRRTLYTWYALVRHGLVVRCSMFSSSLCSCLLKWCIDDQISHLVVLRGYVVSSRHIPMQIFHAFIQSWMGCGFSTMPWIMPWEAYDVLLLWYVEEAMGIHNPCSTSWCLCKEHICDCLSKVPFTMHASTIIATGSTLSYTVN